MYTLTHSLTHMGPQNKTPSNPMWVITVSCKWVISLITLYLRESNSSYPVGAPQHVAEPQDQLNVSNGWKFSWSIQPELSGGSWPRWAQDLVSCRRVKQLLNIMYHGLDLNSHSNIYELCDLKQVTQCFLQTSVPISTKWENINIHLLALLGNTCEALSNCIVADRQ